MSDRIELHGMVFQGRHGVLPSERVEPQPFEVDVVLALDLQPAGLADDLSRTIDYGVVFEEVRRIVESTSYRLIEALAEAIAQEILLSTSAERVTERAVAVIEEPAPAVADDQSASTAAHASTRAVIVPATSLL